MTVSVIYAAMDRLSAEMRISPYALSQARSKLERLEERRARRDRLLNARPLVRMHGQRVA